MAILFPDITKTNGVLMLPGPHQLLRRVNPPAVFPLAPSSSNHYLGVDARMLLCNLNQNTHAGLQEKTKI